MNLLSVELLMDDLMEQEKKRDSFIFEVFSLGQHYLA